jgi:hypothetical protein
MVEKVAFISTEKQVISIPTSENHMSIVSELEVYLTAYPFASRHTELARL